MIKVWHTDETPGCREEYLMVYDPTVEDVGFVTTPEGSWVTTKGPSTSLTVRKHFCPGPVKAGRFLYKAKCSKGI
jgi:hypothetical protein